MGTNTRYGPAGCPSRSVAIRVTRPPAAVMRARSPGRSGLWSSVSGTAAHSGIMGSTLLEPEVGLKAVEAGVPGEAGSSGSSPLDSEPAEPDASDPSRLPVVSTTPSTARESPAHATLTLSRSSSASTAVHPLLL